MHHPLFYLIIAARALPFFPFRSPLFSLWLHQRVGFELCAIIMQPGRRLGTKKTRRFPDAANNANRLRWAAAAAVFQFAGDFVAVWKIEF